MAGRGGAGRGGARHASWLPRAELGVVARERRAFPKRSGEPTLLYFLTLKVRYFSDFVVLYLFK